MSSAIIIPARYGSTRLHGKPLLMLANGSLIEHVWAAASKTGLPVYVATDDDRIRQCVEAFGGEAVMTGHCNNGTERCAQAAKLLGLEGPIINWQGDSPLIPPEWIPSLLARLEDSGAGVVTPVQRCTSKQSAELKHEHRAAMPGGTAAVFDANFRALYFSKAPIPSRGPMWLHVGLYCYTGPALASYGHEEGVLERSERLEQLRFLERGVHIQCVAVDGDPIWEVNNPADLRIVGKMLGGDLEVMR